MVILLMLTIIISLIVSFFGFMFIVIIDLMSEITEISEYKRILNGEGYSSYMYQFPKEIQKDAEDVKFYYRPQFLQGGMEMQLQMKLNDEELQYYINTYENKSKEILNSNDDRSNLSKAGIFHLGHRINDEMIPKNYIIYLLDSKPYKEADWNHGYVIMIAINSKEKRIIFDTEIW